MFSKFKKSFYTSAVLFALPIVTFAQWRTGDDQVGVFGDRIINFINNILVPFVFSVALLLFIYGMFLYFISGADNDDRRKTGKSYILWAIVALVIMVSVWGITNLIAGGLGLNDGTLDLDLIPTAAEPHS